MFNNSLAQEYQLLEEKLGFSRHDIRMLIIHGIESSWLSENQKQQLAASFYSDAAWQE
jgi:adenosine deaminase